MTVCHRCDWQHDRDVPDPPRAQLAAHSAESGHPLCVVCLGSLEPTELQTCLGCLASVRRLMAEIVDLFAMLPETLGHPKGAMLDPDSVTSAKDRPLPGGDALVMLGPGGRGPCEPSDPPAVAFELGTWEDDWRHCRREPAADCDATVISAVSYLSRNAGWAAEHHTAFDEFAGDVRRMHHRLEVATAMDDRPQVGVPCFECGADLRRRLGEEHYACPRCRREYDDASYWLAVRAQLEDERARA